MHFFTVHRLTTPPRSSLIAIFMLLLMVAGCTHNQSMQTLGKTYELLFSAGALTYNPEEVEALPYASIAMISGGGARTLMLAVAADNGRLSWISRNRVVLVTEQGRLVKTGGISYNLGDTRFENKGDWIGQPFDTLDKKKTKREIDFPEKNQFSVPITCILEVLTPEKISIHQHQYPTQPVIEHCEAEVGIKWKFDNQFWLDTDNPKVVWKSIQHFNPRLPRLQIEHIKQFARQ